MGSFNEMVDDEFANSDDEIEAFQVWITYDADKAIVLAAMTAVMQPWMDSERRDKARAMFARAIEDEGR